MRKYLLVFLIVVIALSFTGCLSDPEIPKHELEDVTYTQLMELDFSAVSQIRMSVPFEIDETSSSFEIKDIELDADKKAIYEFLSTLKIEEVEEYDEKMGFDTLIEINSDPQIFVIFNEELMLVNNRKYIADSDIGQLALALYGSMDYPPERLE